MSKIFDLHPDRLTENNVTLHFKDRFAVTSLHMHMNRSVIIAVEEKSEPVFGEECRHLFLFLCLTLDMRLPVRIKEWRKSDCVAYGRLVRHDLLAVGFDYAVADCFQLFFECLIAKRPEEDKRGILGIEMLDHNSGAY